MERRSASAQPSADGHRPNASDGGPAGAAGARAPEAQIAIALQPGRPVLTGHVRVTGEADRPFSGWLGLLSALEGATGVVVQRLDGDGRVQSAEPE